MGQLAENLHRDIEYKEGNEAGINMISVNGISIACKKWVDKRRRLTIYIPLEKVRFPLKDDKKEVCPWERKPIEPFEQDCTKCSKVIDLILGDGRPKFNPEVYEELKRRHSLSFKCFEYYPDGRPKSLRCFPSNLCHLLSICIEAVRSTWVAPERRRLNGRRK